MMPRRVSFILILVLLAGIAVIDYFVPVKVQVAWLYLIPLAVAAPKASMLECLFLSLAATLFWTVSNILATGGALIDFVRLWNSGSRFIIFYSFSSLIHFFVAQLREKQAVLSLLRAQQEKTSPAMGLRRLCHDCGMVQTSKGDWLPLTSWLSRDCMVVWGDSQCPQCAQTQDKKGHSNSGQNS